MTLPRTRADCLDGPRPCPHYACRHHLWMICRGDELPDDSCALDLVDEHPEGLTAHEVASILGVSRQAVECVEKGALGHVRRCSDLWKMNR